MTLTNWRAWLFSGKAFLAACLALYIALRMDLPRPYWAMTSVYVISQPLAGATLSKALYRLLGTALGAVGAVVMVPALVNWPPLLVAAMAAWTGVCLYLSLMDRRPHSYVFMLAGYTAPIIGLASVDTPGDIFLTAVARVEEISLAIVCAGLVSTLVFPQSITTAFAGRVGGWMSRATAWARETLDENGASQPERARMRLATEAADIDVLAAHLGFDPAAPTSGRRWAEMLRSRMLLMLPLTGAIHGRLAALQPHGLTPPTQAAVDAVRQWLAHGAPDTKARELRETIATATPPMSPHSSWADLLRGNLMLRLKELVDLTTDCATLTRHISGKPGRPALALRDIDAARGSAARHVDRGLALRSAAAAALAIVLGCIFWIATAWPEGSSVPVMAAVACCFFSNLDNPVAPQLGFIKTSVFAIALTGAYAFAILPMTDAFLPLVLVLAPALLLAGAIAANPATMILGLLTAADLPTLLGLQSRFSADFPTFVNGGLALIGGGICAALTTALVRVLQPAYVARRITRANHLLLARAAEQRGRGNRAAFASLLLDRVGQIVPRTSGDDAWWAMMGEIRTGLNVVALRRARRALPAPMVTALDGVLDGLAVEFRRRAGERPRGAALDLPMLDHALAMATALPPNPARDDTLLGLIGIRLALFADAPDYAATPTEAAPLLEHAA